MKRGENSFAVKEKVGAGGLKKVFQGLMSIQEMSVFITLIVLCVLLSFTSSNFLTFANIMSVLRQISVTCIIAVGLSFVIISGAMDLSTSATMAIGGVFCAWLCNLGVNAWLSLILTLIMGAGVGMLNSVLTVKLDINPFVATMATMNIIRGFCYLISGGFPISFRTSINFLGEGNVLGVPNIVIIMFIILILGHILFTKTVFGKNVLAVGGNPKAAKMSGVSNFKTKSACFALLGVLCAFAGVLNSCNLGVADLAAGQGYELEFMAAAVIGGTPLSGGQGTILGAVIGAAIMGVIKNAFIILHVSQYWQMVSLGIVILLAVISHKFRGVKLK